MMLNEIMAKDIVRDIANKMITLGSDRGGGGQLIKSEITSLVICPLYPPIESSHSGSRLGSRVGSICALALNPILISISLWISLIALYGCDSEGSTRDLDELIRRCSDAEILNEAGMCEPRSESSGEPDCLDQDKQLCLIELSWRDDAPRPSALTPGERATLEVVTVFNSGADELTVDELTVSALSPHLTLDSHSYDEVSAELWLEEGRRVRASDVMTLDEACARGVIPPREACVFNLESDFEVNEEATPNMAQHIQLVLETDRGQRLELELPLMIVDATEGLEVNAVTFRESSEDGELNSGDRVRFESIRLSHSTLAPFDGLRGLLVPETDGVTLEGDASVESWETIDGIQRGLSSAQINCSAARVDSGSLERSACELSFEGELIIPQDLELESLQLTLYLEDRGSAVSEPHSITLQVEPWTPELNLGALELSVDENRDLAPSAGELITIRQITLLNEGESAVSLRGRVSVDSPIATLSPSSDASVSELILRDDFYENCPAGEACALDVNLIIEVDERAALGEVIPISVELIDQAGMTHTLIGELEITLPDLDFEFEDFEVSQDTLDPALSPGERGQISYIKIVNRGDADALGVSIELSVNSPHIVFEDPDSLSWSLRSSSETFDERESVCPALTLEPESYCYTRDVINFTVSEDAPLGERVTFSVDVTDRSGVTQTLTHEITLF